MRRYYLEKMAKKELTEAQVAEALKLSVRHVRRLFAESGLKRPLAKDKEAAEQAKKRLNLRREMALRAYKDEISPQQAAKLAGVSTRTIYRHIKRIQEMLNA